MATTVQFGNPAIVVDDENNTLHVNFADGSGVEIPGGPDALQQWIVDNSPTIDQVKAMAIEQRFAIDPMLDSPEVWNSKRVTINLESDAPSTVFTVI